MLIPGITKRRLEPGAVVAALAMAGRRVTEPRRAVIELIAAQDGPFTAAAIEAAAAGRGTSVGRATVFRTLELLVGLDVVERLDLPTGEHAYVACDSAHHHHLVCTACGRSTHVPDLGIGSVLGDVASQTGFRIDRHRLELYGICPDCRGTPEREAAMPAQAGGRRQAASAVGAS